MHILKFMFCFAFCFAAAVMFQIQHGVGELDIIPIYLHQGAFMKHVLQITTEANNGLIPDFIFVIGDGASDERMFSSVLSFVSSQFQPPKPSKLFIEVAAAAWNETQAEAAELAGNEAMHSAAVAAASSSANNKSKVNNTILEVEDEDDENPLSLAAEKMLDEKPGQLSETTSKILSDAAKASMSSGASSKGAASASSSKAGNNNNSSSNSNGAYQAMFNRNKIARMESFMGGAEVDTTVFTCTVGKKASCAGTFMENVKDVEHLLKALSKVA